MAKLAKTLGAAAGLLALAGGGAIAANSVLGIIPKSLNGTGGGGAKISCNEGKRLLRESGYPVTQVIDCRPSFYMYFAMRQGNYYVVTVDARHARIIAVSRDH